MITTQEAVLIIVGVDLRVVATFLILIVSLVVVVSVEEKETIINL